MAQEQDQGIVSYSEWGYKTNNMITLVKVTRAKEKQAE